MRKGITPVVAVIMLVLIVVSLVGGIFVWMQRTMGGIQDTIGNQTQKQASDMGKALKIQDHGCGSGVNVYVENIGSSAIDSANVFVNGSMCGSSQSISIDQTVGFTCDVSDGERIRATAGNAEDEIVAEC